MVGLALEIILLLDSKNIDIGKCEPSTFYTYMVSMDSSQCPLSLSKNATPLCNMKICDFSLSKENIAPLCTLKNREFIRSINRSDVERNNRGSTPKQVVLRTLQISRKPRR
jgi:hypothetical protein